MNYTISDDRKQLTITATPDERAILHRDEDIQSDAAMRDWLEPLTRNSELEWINPDETGDLTSAPMLGILGEDETASHLHKHYYAPEFYGWRHSGFNGEEATGQRILERWAYSPYQVRSVLEDLRDNGVAIFIA